MEMMLAALAAVQVAALAILLARLLPGRRRHAPIPPGSAPAGSISVVLPTLNEARRIGPCLAGLARQGAEVGEIVVVDSGSTDGTRDIVALAARGDGRIRMVDDGPLPVGWVGKVWALERGLAEARSPWVLGVDADVEPRAGMAGGVLAAASRHRYDVLSLAPRFAGQGAGERWLQPALLTTLIYRVGAAGPSGEVNPERVMANGQCFLARREVLLANGGFAPARTSYSDDVTLARHLARRGVRVGFMDGSRLLDVRAYTSAAETWREWGRSLDLKDSTSALRQWGDVLFLLLVQGFPIPVLAGLTWAAARSGEWWPAATALLAVNAALIGVRLLMNVALRRSYERRGLPFWLSPLADPLAAIRIVLSTARRPRSWRGRSFVSDPPGRAAPL